MGWPSTNVSLSAKLELPAEGHEFDGIIYGKAVNNASCHCGILNCCDQAWLEVGPNQACDPLPFFDDVQAAGYPHEAQPCL